MMYILEEEARDKEMKETKRGMENGCDVKGGRRRGAGELDGRSEKRKAEGREGAAGMN